MENWKENLLNKVTGLKKGGSLIKYIRIYTTEGVIYIYDFNKRVEYGKKSIGIDEAIRHIKQGDALFNIPQTKWQRWGFVEYEFNEMTQKFI